MASSSTMPPPTSPLAHRRTQPSSTLGVSSCVRRKMSLPKADTFHQSSSPSTADDPVLSVAHLAKRSTTYTRSSFASWLYSGREAAADVIADFEQTFSGARGSRPATRRRSAREFEETLLAKDQLQRASSPVDSGIGSSVGSPSEKNLSRTLDRALDLTSTRDSALGGSITSSVAEGNKLIKGWLTRTILICASKVDSSTDTNTTKTRQAEKSSQPTLRIIHYPNHSQRTTHSIPLSNLARRQIYKFLFGPLLQDARLHNFKHIVTGIRKNKTLRCLRDIEQSLINQPVVSTVYPLINTASNSSAKSLPVTATEYKTFGDLAVQLVVDTHQHLSESEQRRSTDRAYDNGYFLDLVQQVQQLAAHIGSSDTNIETGEQPSVDDEITLEGGLSETGNLAELVRWKNGQGTSLRTGLPYVPLAGTKRMADTTNDAEFSARRKKGVEYPVNHLPCKELGCDKVFSRPCDLSKHQKTHSRPYRCPHDGCKYSEAGLPTEKELDRHMNDKHNDRPKLFCCEFQGCNFSTKRQSNCKQHMEKKHGWNYIRSKGKDKNAIKTPRATPKTPAEQYSSAEASPVFENMNLMDSPGPSTSYSSGYQNAGATNNLYPGLFPRAVNNPVSGEFDFNSSALYPQDQLQVETSGFNAVPGSGMSYQAYPTPASIMQQQFSPHTPAYSTITPSPMVSADNNVPNYGFHGSMAASDAGQANTYPGSSHYDAQFEGHNSFATNSFDPAFDFNNVGMLSGDDFQLITSNTGAFTQPNSGEMTLFPMIPALDDEMSYTADDFAKLDSDNGFDDHSFEGNLDLP